MNGKIAAVQCGCRRKRSTVDHLVRLETVVRRAFAHSEHVVSVFFDLKKAYDTVWKHGIMSDPHALGLHLRMQFLTIPKEQIIESTDEWYILRLFPTRRRSSPLLCVEC